MIRPAGATTEVPPRSSMESFLDEYQLVRLILSLIGLALIGGFALSGYGPPLLVPYAIGLAGTGFHAYWCRHNKIRAPRAMLVIDLTLWGSLWLLMADMPVVTTSSLAFLVLLAVLFSDGIWMIGFLVYVVGWYGAAYFMGHDLTLETAGGLASVLLTIGGLAMVMYRIRGWLGRLDANRSQMLGTVSHELRNTLTGMMGLTEVVSTATDLGPDETRELIGLAHQQTVDASEIIEDLLTVSRLEQAALRVGVEEVDVNQEVATTVRRFVSAGTEVTVGEQETLPMASGDALRVRQILRNLVSNAVRYGGSAIAVTTLAARDGVQIIVGDDGPGVAREDESTIFLPYRRSSNTPADVASVGLGLWICRQLAHEMGGSLEYRRVDGWTQFVFTLKVFGHAPARLAQAIAQPVDRIRRSPSEAGITMPAVVV
jgi:signal transduction histidine kinase